LVASAQLPLATALITQAQQKEQQHRVHRAQIVLT
jgi:hypothetical protein